MTLTLFHFLPASSLVTQGQEDDRIGECSCLSIVLNIIYFNIWAEKCLHNETAVFSRLTSINMLKILSIIEKNKDAFLLECWLSNHF